MITLVQSTRDYFSHCEVEKGLSKLTIKAYRQDLSQFMKFVGCEALITQVDKYLIRKFIEDLIANHLKESTIIRKLASIKAYFSYLEYEEMITVSPVHKLGIRFRPKVQIPEIMNLREIDKILSLPRKKLGESLH